MLDAREIRSVSEITGEIKATLSDNDELNGFYVRGEISQITRKAGRRPGSQYLYFTLKDENAVLSCAMFEGVRSLDFEPAAGDMVVCGGCIDVYVPYGKYQMICYSMEMDGEGEAAAALQRLVEKLKSEGIFDRKRPFPEYPNKIAVITSPTGAVVHDVIETTAMRYPVTEICVIPAVVQGEGAVPSLVDGLAKAQNVGADVIIIGRGGGSKEDLNCFNSEQLARAIYASEIPVISAVGHETDTTIADLAADARASTPTQAAEIAVPDIRNVLGQILHYRKMAEVAADRVLGSARKELELLEKDIRLYSPYGRITQWENNLARLDESMSNNIHRRIAKAEYELAKASQSVGDLNPMSVLQRGYSFVKKDGRVVSSKSDVECGNMLEITFADGGVLAEVKEIRK